MSPAQSSGPTGATLPYSARLQDTAGAAMPDGAYDFVFSLHDAAQGGLKLWSETQLREYGYSGALNTVLGSVTAIPVDVAARKDLWLAVSVRGPNETAFTPLDPRQRFPSPNSPSALTCPHSHFTDVWSGNTPNYGLWVDQAGLGDGIRSYTKASTYDYASFYGYNTGTGTAVFGLSSLGRGVYAESAGYDALEAVTSADGKSAVYAHTAAPRANGVWAASYSGAGAVGRSVTGDGISGQSAGAGKSGVFGLNTVTTSVGYGVFGRAPYGFGLSADGKDDSGSDNLGDLHLAGARGEILTGGQYMEFYSNGWITFDLDDDNNGTHQLEVWSGDETLVFKVEENGNTTATGTKSAEVPTADFGKRLVYSMESPEVWFEDFGSATLKGGSATVALDPVFAQTVNLTQDYRVFLTPLGDCGLYVAQKTAAGFTVKALGGATCSIDFDYRVVARRLGYEDIRLAPANTQTNSKQAVSP